MSMCLKQAMLDRYINYNETDRVSGSVISEVVLVLAGRKEGQEADFL